MIFRCFAATGHLFCFPFGTDNKHKKPFLETILVYFQTSTGMKKKPKQNLKRITMATNDDNLDHATPSNSGLQLLIGRQSHKLACWKQPLSKQLQSDSNRQSLTSSHQFIKQSLWTALSQALCWKKIQWLNDYHPVALTSLVMKWFEELVLALNRKGVPPLYINTSFLTGKKGQQRMTFHWPFTSSCYSCIYGCCHLL